VREEGRENREEAEDKEGLGSLILYIKLISSSCWMFGCVACQQTRSFFIKNNILGFSVLRTLTREHTLCAHLGVYMCSYVYTPSYTHTCKHTQTHTHTPKYTHHTHRQT
jgi:hypothetical protein